MYVPGGGGRGGVGRERNRERAKERTKEAIRAEGGSWPQSTCIVLYTEELRFHPEGFWKLMKVFNREMYLRTIILAV